MFGGGILADPDLACFGMAVDLGQIGLVHISYKLTEHVGKVMRIILGNYTTNCHKCQARPESVVLDFRRETWYNY